MSKERLYYFHDNRWWLYAVGLPSFISGWREVFRKNGACTAVERVG